MNIHALETRSALSLETRSDENDNLDEATRVVEELRSGFQNFQTRTDERLAGIDDLGRRLSDLEKRAARPGTSSIERKEEISLERRAFTNFIRVGREALSAEEIRALVVSDDTSGGYLAAPEFVAEVIKALPVYSPMRQAARVGATSGPSVLLPVRTSRVTATWAGEEEDRQTSQNAYGQIEIPVHELTTFVDVSTRLLEDSAVNIEQEVAIDLAEEFGIKEGAAFVSGDGIKKPVGFMGATGIGEIVAAGTNTVTGDELLNLIYALPAPYRPGASWMMNAVTLNTLRRLKDGQGNYLWQPSYQAGQPEMLCGYPVIEAPDMPNLGTGNYPIAFGNFSLAYRIYDRVGMSILRDPYSVATKGLVRFHARRRVGGGTVNVDAIRRLKNA